MRRDGGPGDPTCSVCRFGRMVRHRVASPVCGLDHCSWMTCDLCSLTVDLRTGKAYRPPKVVRIKGEAEGGR